MSANPNVTFRLGRYKEPFDHAMSEGNFATRTEVLHDAVENYLFGPGRFPKPLLERLEGYSKAYKKPVSEIIEMLLELHVGELEKSLKRARTNR